MAQAVQQISNLIKDWGLWLFALATAIATSFAAYRAWASNRPELEIDAQKTELGSRGTILFNCQLDVSNPSSQSMFIEQIRAVMPTYVQIAGRVDEQSNSGDVFDIPGQFLSSPVILNFQVTARSAGKIRFYASIPDNRSPDYFSFEVTWRKKSRSMRPRRWIRYARIID